MVKVKIDKDYIESEKNVYFFIKLVINKYVISTSTEISKLFLIDKKDYNQRTIKLAKQIGADVFQIDEDKPENEDYLTFVFSENNIGKLEQFKQKFKEEFLKELVIANF